MSVLRHRGGIAPVLPTRWLRKLFGRRVEWEASFAPTTPNWQELTPTRTICPRNIEPSWHSLLILLVLAFGPQAAPGQAAMQAFNTEWLASEHQRLHNVEQWLDSPRKQAVLGAIQSTLDSLSRHPGTAQGKFSCFLCESRKAKLKVLEPRAYREPVPILTGSTEWKRTG